ncbi:MAG: hypothetical protein WBJ68_10030 [Candidatus Dechloromonas phosphoritropha]|jgi:hypothetical protein
MGMPTLADLRIADPDQHCAAHATKYGDGMPDAQKIRFYERVRDFAVQAYHDRGKGPPMKVFVEDGSAGAHITKIIIRRIYDEVEISSPKKAETVSRDACNEMMGSKGLAE